MHLISSLGDYISSYAIRMYLCVIVLTSLYSPQQTMRRGRAGPGDAAAGAGSRRREPRAGPRAQPPGAGSRRGRRPRCGGGAGGRKTASGAGYSRQRAGDEPGLGDAAAGAVSRRPGPAGRRRRELRGVVVGCSVLVGYSKKNVIISCTFSSNLI